MLSQESTTKVLGKENYFYWGYHRSFYAPSDIHFHGPNYDFTLYNAKALDMPASLDQYFDLKNFSVPQYNLRWGHELKNNWFLSVGQDHFKYRLVTTQNVRIGGYIDPACLGIYNADTTTTPANQYTGNFSSNDSVLYRREFMDFHHSNGMNYLRVALEKRIHLLDIPKAKSKVDMFAGVAGGAIICWTDYTFFRTRYLNNLHLSGFGLGVVYGFRYVFNDRMFLQYSFQNGVNFLYDIQLENKGSEARAEQRIHYFERGVTVGYVFRTGKKG